MKRHLRWLIPLLCVPIVFLGCGWAAYSIESAPNFSTSRWHAVAAFAVLAGMFVGVTVAAILAIVGGVKTFRRWRRSKGHYSGTERKAMSRTAKADDERAAAWGTARQLRQRLIAREVPPEIRVWDVVPQGGEVMFFDLSADYARYFGTRATYAHSGGFFFGPPAFVLAGAAASGIGNATRRSAAVAAAQPAWREWQPSRVIVTNQRLICQAGGRWLSFYYAAMTAVYPEVEKWTLVCEFAGNVNPLLLSGLNAPTISVLTVLLTHGPEAVETHPSFARMG